MQELLEKLQKSFDEKTYPISIDGTYFLEKEKEQIMRDFKNGYKSHPVMCEEYYNQTYNQDRVTINETKRSIEEIGKLIYYKDTTIGLWATDRLDLIPDEIKHLFFKLK